MNHAAPKPIGQDDIAEWELRLTSLLKQIESLSTDCELIRRQIEQTKREQFNS